MTLLRTRLQPKIYRIAKIRIEEGNNRNNVSRIIMIRVTTILIIQTLITITVITTIITIVMLSMIVPTSGTKR